MRHGLKHPRLDMCDMRSRQLIGLSPNDDQYHCDDAHHVPLRFPFVEDVEALDIVPSFMDIIGLFFTAAWT